MPRCLLSFLRFDRSPFLYPGAYHSCINSTYLCLSVNCEYDEWKDKDNATCSRSCGGGTIKQIRTKTIAENSAGTCDNKFEQEAPCNTEVLCPGNK